jgi:hypothetical protein
LTLPTCSGCSAVLLNAHRFASPYPCFLPPIESALPIQLKTKAL